jgi:hypothetical protein
MSGMALAANHSEAYNSSMMRAYEEIVEFIAAGTSPANVVAFRPSEQAKERVADLIHQGKINSLSPDEEAELVHYLQIEHLMRLAKARARQHLVNG